MANPATIDRRQIASHRFARAPSPCPITSLITASLPLATDVANVRATNAGPPQRRSGGGLSRVGWREPSRPAPSSEDHSTMGKPFYPPKPSPRGEATPLDYHGATAQSSGQAIVRRRP